MENFSTLEMLVPTEHIEHVLCTLGSLNRGLMVGQEVSMDLSLKLNDIVLIRDLEPDQKISIMPIFPARHGCIRLKLEYVRVDRES